MTDQTKLEELLDRWDDARQAGAEPDLVSLCRETPELMPQLRERIRAFLAMDQALHRAVETGAGESNGDRTHSTDVSRSAAPAEPPAGSRMEAASQYWIQRPHARGGLGEVLIAEDRELFRTVAIKRLHTGSRQDASRFARFQREAVITGQLDHPGIVPILSMGQDENGSPFYAMKFIEGVTLADRVRELHDQFKTAEGASADAGRQFEARVLRPLLSRFVSVCNTIAYAHSRNIIHRDLKPANIMLGEFGATYVVDWGLARHMSTSAVRQEHVDVTATIISDAETVHPADSATDKDSDFATDTLTRTGAVMGTPAFMSPEQAMGKSAEIGPASDIYSLGATLWFLLAGRAAITTSGDMSWLEQLKSGNVPRPSSVQKQIPAPLESVCLKAMQRDPATRYATASALAEDIEHWLADEPVAAHRDDWSTRLARFSRRHRAWTQAGTAALILIALISTGFAILLQERRAAAERAESVSRRLAGEKSALAEKESAARERADEQSSLALATLRTVIFQVARNLKGIEGAAAVRTQLLTTAIDGLGRVAKTLDTRMEADRNLMVAHNDIGRIYMSAGAMEKVNTTAEALRHFQQATAIARTLQQASPGDDGIARDLSVACEFAGDAFLQMGRLDDADREYAESLRVSEQRLQRNPSSVSVQQDAGFGYEKVGDALLTRGRLPEARQHFLRSLELYQQIVSARPQEASYHRDLLVAKSKLGNIQREEGRLVDAAATFRECVATCKTLETIPGSGAQRRDRSIMLNKLGTVLLMQGDTAAAAAAFADGLAIARELVAAEAASDTARRDLTISLKYVGETFRKAGDLAAARAAFDECLALRRVLASEDASNQMVQVDLASVLTELGDIELESGNTDAARPLIEEAASILTGLLDAGTLSGADDLKLLDRVHALKQRFSATER
jgi:serine/threonine-protein kinase